MKKSIFIVFFIFSSLGGAATWIYNEINNLKSEIFSLKEKNLVLKSKNKKLVSKQNEINKKIKERRKTLETKKITRAKHKLAKASVGVLPFIGTAAVVGLTYDELQGYCQDIKEYKKFEESIFGTISDTQSEEEKALCGYDYNAVENIVLKDIESYKNQSSQWFDSQYDSWQKTITEQYSKFVSD